MISTVKTIIILLSRIYMTLYLLNWSITKVEDEGVIQDLCGDFFFFSSTFSVFIIN